MATRIGQNAPMSVQSWQISCPRCGWSNSGAERRCMKCGQPLRTAPGLLVAGQTGGAVVGPAAAPKRVVQPGGFFPRLIAVIIDGLILAVIVVPAYLLWQAGVASAGSVNQPSIFTDKLGFFLGMAILQLFYFVGTW